MRVNGKCDWKVKNDLSAAKVDRVYGEDASCGLSVIPMRILVTREETASEIVGCVAEKMRDDSSDER